MDTQGIIDVLEHSCRAMSQQAFLSVFTENINRQAEFSGSLCFKLDSMKECLNLASSTFSSLQKNVLSFSLSDEQNPIVYALTSNKPYLVQDPSILYTSSICELSSFIKGILPRNSMLCYPFKYGENKLNYGVFVFFATPEKIENMQKNTLYHRLFNIMVEILRVYSIAEIKGKETKAIKDNWAQISRSNYQKTVREHIETQCIGSSKSIQKVWDLIARAAASEVAVLLRGETGVGKDLAASLIHQYSRRSKKRFIVVNCAAIPENLLESELFGYRKGAFTGATQHKQGLIKQADGGTLFLDEIGDLSEMLQAKLLRVLQEKSFIPVGGHEEESSNFRLITATHRSLEEKIEKGQFRQDLFYRINQFNITIPALTERKKDIPDLVNFFTSLYIQENAMHISGYEKSAMKLLQEYNYPGNIRELKNIVFQACMFVGANNLVTYKNIKTILDSVIKIDLKKNVNSQNEPEVLVLGETLPEAIEAFEQNLIRKALKESGGSRLIAAKTLGIPKRTLAYKCKKWNISNGY